MTSYILNPSRSNQNRYLIKTGGKQPAQNRTSFTKATPLDETHLDAVTGLIELRGFHPSASTSGARRSEAATSDKDKQICFLIMPRT